MTTISKLCFVVLLWTVTFSASLAIMIVPIDPALANSVQPNVTTTTQQAAKEVVKDTGVKQQFGKSKNGEQLIDKAQQKANQKLNQLANEANQSKDLPDSKKLFLDNLTDNN